MPEEKPDDLKYLDLYVRAASLYHETGDEQKAGYYENLVEQIKSKEYDPYDYEEAEEQKTIVKDKKIYPNAPCPCGSGKKYKKCCGK